MTRAIQSRWRHYYCPVKTTSTYILLPVHCFVTPAAQPVLFWFISHPLEFIVIHLGGNGLTPKSIYQIKSIVLREINYTYNISSYNNYFGWYNFNGQKSKPMGKIKLSFIEQTWHNGPRFSHRLFGAKIAFK